MANMLNSARQAKERALKVLSETEMYVTGVSHDGKKIIYYLIEKLKNVFEEINRAIGEMDNVLPQYNDTALKNEMLELRSKLEERERILRAMLDRR